MTQYTGMEIAIIGMAGTFPGADSVDEFWENIKNGVDSVSTFSAEELVEEGIDRESIDHPDYVKCRQVVQGKEFFDSSFFDYLPNEAALMDPQMRVFHQTVWEGLEDAGYTSEGFNGLIGLYAGNSSNFDWEAAARMSEAAQAVDGFTAMQLTGRDFLTTRVAHKLNLKGPALFLQTACSTSLVAVHTACRALLTGDCHIAVAGGVKIDYNFKKGYLFQEGMIGSPDGHCRAFDAKAKGTVGSEGSAVVVLKKLKKALADRDYIYAVIKGSGINNDGLRKVGYTAPSVDGQADAIRMAYKVGRVEPQSISYVEAHGTATALGDPIEAEALIAVFGKDKEKTCGLGSVKSNVGHMDSAAGVGGLIKTALALKHKLMPPSLYFENPNPAIDFVNSPFYVNTALKEWTGKSPLRAGVSSFGIGGTNAHAILEEAPQPEPAAADRLYKLLPFSAKSAGALERLTAKLGTFFKKNTDCHLADAAYTLQVGREAFNHRSVLVCQDGAEAARKLAAGDFKTFSTKKEKKQVVFMFPGQGSQYVNMARGLYETEPLFRQEMDNCFELIADASGGSATRTGIIPSAGSAKGRRPLDPQCSVLETDLRDLKTVLFPKTGTDDDGLINRTDITQPLLFIVQYAMAKLLIHWGIAPDSMIGHSIGEYTAACISGVFSLQQALQLVVLRGKLMQDLPEGAMLSLPLAEADVIPLLETFNRTHEKISIAAFNGPRNCVVSGNHGDIEAFQQTMKQKGIQCRTLLTSHAFHSSMMEPILSPFREAVAAVPPGEPRIPFISNVTGTQAEAASIKDPQYWSNHIRQPVRFADGISALLQRPNTVFIEVGPGKTLCTFVRQFQEVPAPQDSQKVSPALGFQGAPPFGPPGGKTKTAFQAVETIRHPKEQAHDSAFLLERLGELWLYGLSPFWTEFHRDRKRRRVPLPTYPFEKIAYPLKADVYKMLSTIMRAQGGSALQTETVPAPNRQSPSRETPPQTEAPAYALQRPDLTTPYVEPATDIEKELAVVWRGFFGLDKVGVKDDFFQLGGDSLKAMTVATEIHRHLQVEITPAEFFTHPTISELAAYMEQAERTVFQAVEVVEKKEYHVVSSAQKRLFLTQHINPQSVGYNLQETVPLPGPLDKERLESTFQKLIQRHESLRTSFFLHQDQPVQKVHDAVDFQVAVLRLPEAEPEPEAETEAQAEPKSKTEAQAETEAMENARMVAFQRLVARFVVPFDLGCAPLLRAAVVSFDEDAHLLVADIHHIVTDGVSFSILFREFANLYAEPEAQLPPLKVQYKDYSKWQHGLQSGDIGSQQAYWVKQMEGELPLLDLPVDYPYPPGARTHDGARILFAISGARYEGLKRLAAEEGKTMYFILLSVYYVLFHKYTGQEDIIVGTGSAGRRHVDLQGIIGIFIVVLAMRNRPSGRKTFLEFVEEVGANALAAFENEDYPFEELVKTISPPVRPGGSPFFDVAFQLQNIDMPGRGAAPVDEVQKRHAASGPGTAHYDLTVYATETADRVKMDLVYSTELFKSETVDRMVDHYLEILDIVLANRDILLKDIDISTGLLEVGKDMLQQDDGDFNF